MRYSVGLITEQVNAILNACVRAAPDRGPDDYGYGRRGRPRAHGRAGSGPSRDRGDAHGHDHAHGCVRGCAHARAFRRRGCAGGCEDARDHGHVYGYVHEFPAWLNPPAWFVDYNVLSIAEIIHSGIGYFSYEILFLLWDK